GNRTKDCQTSDRAWFRIGASKVGCRANQCLAQRTEANACPLGPAAEHPRGLERARHECHLFPPLVRPPDVRLIYKRRVLSEVLTNTKPRKLPRKPPPPPPDDFDDDPSPADADDIPSEKSQYPALRMPGCSSWNDPGPTPPSLNHGRGSPSITLIHVCVDTIRLSVKPPASNNCRYSSSVLSM